MKRLLLILLCSPIIGFGQNPNEYLSKAKQNISNGEFEDAIYNCTRALRIDPNYADAYYNRGLAKEGAELSYCSDYKKCCDLGYEGCCSSYNGQSGQTPCE